jgi:hypothetical protein
MIKISRSDMEALRKVGLIKEGSEHNYTVTNRKKHSSQKDYYVVEDRKILAFLNRKKEY